jgi:hypothetical protein
MPTEEPQFDCSSVRRGPMPLHIAKRAFMWGVFSKAKSQSDFPEIIICPIRFEFVIDLKTTKALKSARYK